MSSSPALPAPAGINPLPGTVCTQYIDCGKPGCRCQTGELHGPYHYRVWREGDRVCKAYVRQEDVEAVQVACQDYRDIVKFLSDARKHRQYLSKSIRRECKKLQRLQKSRRLPQAGHTE